ncbi:sigma-54 interaction domain-containing protein [Alterisphingorhabdus coralli]|uniref:Sigma-54 dependent transcriptional regulator n=1 Tax=Alterisphingorhabdus coralli TaxID=3071408 RepID=A0AA97I1I5_9SPHN|nr:sigma-54 dependent transcriptional regulator [Parasphingorhabdus sp. SCSIO 66989]WOE74780.1 sigma-54 dependent transcriptional regulator [Parasphingorhabdus sp. SCSIO 66989]
MPETEIAIDQAIIGNSAAIHEVRCFLKFAAATNASVLITGPSGCGKEIIANTLHAVSPRADQAFVAVNSGAIPKDLVEAEFFGHEKGSFTGADNQRRGHFERADGGTLFLDEIGEMTSAMQVRLLRILEDGKVRRVGGAEDIAVDVRMIAATHQCLETRIGKGEFREDLFYRLCVLPLRVPALNQRRDDIEPLIRHFLCNKDGSQSFTRFTREAMLYLQDHDWPGNVRELRNVVMRAKIIYPDDLIGAEQIAKLMHHGHHPGAISAKIEPFPAAAGKAELATMRGDSLEDALPPAFSLKEHLLQEERRLLSMALAQADGVVAAAARLVQLERTTFVEKMKRHNLVRKEALAA